MEKLQGIRAVSIFKIRPTQNVLDVNEALSLKTQNITSDLSDFSSGSFDWKIELHQNSCLSLCVGDGWHTNIKTVKL